MRKRLLWPCLLLTAAALALYPILSHFYFEQQKALPPGISRRETRLLRIWLLGDLQGAEGFLKKQAAAFEKQRPDCRIYLRSAQPSELQAPQTHLPDGVVFAPGCLANPEALLTPLAGDWPIPDRLLLCGKWQAKQYALPLLLGGYALARQTQGEGFEAAPGVPLLLAAPEKASSDAPTQSKVYENFAAGRVERAILTLRQVRSLNAREYPFTAQALAWGFTDLGLAGGVMGPKGLDALAFIQFLLSDESQQGLAAYGLFSVNPALTLYDESTPLMAQAESVFQSHSALPSFFAFDQEKARALSLGLHEQGMGPDAAFERLQ